MAFRSLRVGAYNDENYKSSNLATTAALTGAVDLLYKYQTTAMHAIATATCQYIST